MLWLKSKVVHEQDVGLLVFSVHLQTNHRTDEHGTVHVFITVPFNVVLLTLPRRVICQIQLLHVLSNTPGLLDRTKTMENN